LHVVANALCLVDHNLCISNIYILTTSLSRTVWGMGDSDEKRHWTARTFTTFNLFLVSKKIKFHLLFLNVFQLFNNFIRKIHTILEKLKKSNLHVFFGLFKKIHVTILYICISLLPQKYLVSELEHMKFNIAAELQYEVLPRKHRYVKFVR
jgi:hypothetical protein